MTNDELATKLLCALSAETLHKAECFDYVCWLNETHQSEKVKCADFVELASDGRTCWGKTYAEAIEAAMRHDKELYEAWKNLDLPEPDPESPTLPN